MDILILIIIILFSEHFTDLGFSQAMGHDLHYNNKPQVLKEFGFPDGYDRSPKVTFCGIVDVLNDFIIDGLMGERGIGEMTLIHQNIQNCMNLI